MLYQNSAYWYEIQIDNLDDVSTLHAIEFTFGNISKIYPSEDVVYDNNVFRIKLSQSETLSLNDKTAVQARIKFANGDILPTKIEYDNVQLTLSKMEI